MKKDRETDCVGEGIFVALPVADNCKADKVVIHWPHVKSSKTLKKIIATSKSKIKIVIPHGDVLAYHSGTRNARTCSICSIAFHIQLKLLMNTFQLLSKVLSVNEAHDDTTMIPFEVVYWCSG